MHQKHQKLPFHKIQKARLYEEAADQIKHAIFDGVLKPGDRLPSERELCEMFGVGRPTIRESLRILENMGLIEIGIGAKGSTVKEVDVTQYMEAVREQLSCLIRVDEEEIKDLWEVRRYIEVGIAHSAALNATEEDFTKLDRLVEEMDACGDDINSYFPVAIKFHQQLAQASKNRIFYVIWEIFHHILLKGYMPILDKLFPEGPSRLREPNKTILQAIKSKDPVAIDRAMMNHAEEERFYLRDDAAYAYQKIMNYR